jgi:hypothetical protein
MSYVKSKRVQIFPIIAISLYILVSSTYGQYYALASADFISHNPKFESFDQEYLSVANQSELKGSKSGSFYNDSQLVPHLFGQFCHFVCQGLSFDQKNLVLRC